MQKAKWIWYPGDYEIYHNLLVHTLREQRGVYKPAFWKLDSCFRNVKFRKTIQLEKKERIKIICNALGSVYIDDTVVAAGSSEHTLAAGEHRILIELIKHEGLPCVYVEGDTVRTDESWEADNYNAQWVSAGCNEMHADPTVTPEIFPFEYEEMKPVNIEALSNGVLYDFGRETFAKLKFEGIKNEHELPVYYGESREEALDIENCIMTDYAREGCLIARGFRYIFVAKTDGAYDLSALYEYIPFTYRGKFRCNDELLNKIWDVSAYTLHLTGREFFLDGLKRDRWVWSGDAYQSYLMNYYLFFDKDICKRTMIALRGKDPMERHINTIIDYSFYWIMGIYDYYLYTGDIAFVEYIFPKMKSLMDFCISRSDDDGFVRGREGDWIFIDWADMDKTGAVCAEQVLFAKCLETMAQCCVLFNENNSEYRKRFNSLKENIFKYFWNVEKGGLVDSYESGENNITRHANIFALMFVYVTTEQRESIIKNILKNDHVPSIKTPYFKLYELDFMCSSGDIEQVTKQIRDYWGGMLDLGATSFWEKYDPDVKGIKQLEMYKHPYGKSLCHAWGASPIYLFGKYYLGVKPTLPGYETFEVKPNLGELDFIDGIVPVNGGEVRIYMDRHIIKVFSNIGGGALIYGDIETDIAANTEITIPLREY